MPLSLSLWCVCMCPCLYLCVCVSLPSLSPIVAKWFYTDFVLITHDWMIVPSVLSAPCFATFDALCPTMDFANSRSYQAQLESVVSTIQIPVMTAWTNTFYFLLLWAKGLQLMMNFIETFHPVSKEQKILYSLFYINPFLFLAMVTLKSERSEWIRMLDINFGTMSQDSLFKG